MRAGVFHSAVNNILVNIFTVTQNDDWNFKQKDGDRNERQQNFKLLEYILFTASD